MENKHEDKTTRLVPGELPRVICRFRLRPCPSHPSGLGRERDIYVPGYSNAFGGLGYGYGGLGYGYGGLNRYSNEGRSFTSPNYGFRYANPVLGNEDFTPYAGTPGEGNLGFTGLGDPLLNAGFTPGTGVSGDISTSPPSALTRQSFYAGPASTPEKIEFHVKVPTADTKLYFNGNLVDQEGDDRRLGTVPLKEGIIYAYIVKATWVTSDGRQVSYVKSLHAKAGQNLLLDFTTRAPKAE